MKPDRIGPYRIQETVAEDAATVTYRVEDPGLGRTLLLKTARDPAAPALARDRLLREAKLVAPLSHAGVLVLHGLVRKDDAVHLLFEDARGPRLSELLGRTPRLLPAHALAIAEAIAEALAHLHARGLVHGGLRPDRVALAPGGAVRLVDLSTARPAGAPPPEDDEPQRPPMYMAPEQILAEGAGLRADVFSAGVVLFEMLAGRRPWSDIEGSPGVEARRALAHRIRNARPPELATAEGAPAESVARIVARCLAKDPADRYEDARALAEDLADARSEASPEPAATLVVRALAAANFVADLPPKVPRGEVELSPERAGLSRLATQLAAVLGLIVFGALVTEWSRAGDRPAPPPSEAVSGPKGYLRVLAQPWAEVIVDGEAIDTTPMARPIAVAPGRHFVTFVHPNAPEEKRTVNVAAGQTVLIDVAMRVERPHRDAGREAGAVDDSP
jgi:serine/threonine-protein kinase